MRRLSGKVLFCLIAALFVLGPPQALAGDRLYVGLEGGVSLHASDFGVSQSFLHHPTRCDSQLYPAGTTPPGGEECRVPRRSTIANAFRPGAGFAGGAAAGYAFSNGLRIEAEYLNRRQGSETKLTRLGSDSRDVLDRKRGEWDENDPPSERLYSLSAHHFFLNVYYDLRNGSSFTPYVGAGAGVGSTRMRYSARFLRRKDLGSEVWQMAAAGTVSSIDTALRDTRFGFQFAGGADYAVGENFSAGVKIRWTRFGAFEKGGIPWDLVRDHGSVRADGVTPLTADFEVEAAGVWTFTAVLKYYLPL